MGVLTACSHSGLLLEPLVNKIRDDCLFCFMRYHTMFWEILQEIEDLSPRLRLQLPANRESIGRQLGCVIMAKQRLEEVYDRVQALVLRHRLTNLRSAYLQLGQILDEILWHADSYSLLTEELSIDPVGSHLCFQSIDAAIAADLQQIQALSRSVPLPQRLVS